MAWRSSAYDVNCALIAQKWYKTGTQACLSRLAIYRALATETTAMGLTVEQAMQQGITAHQAGNLQQAEQLYRAVLQAQPNHPDASHNLGLIALAANRPGAALALFKIALEENPHSWQFWLSCIDTLGRLKQLDAARAYLKQGAELNVPKANLELLKERLAMIPAGSTVSIEETAKAYRTLGVALKGLGKLEAAESSYRKAIDLKPDLAEAHFNLGNTLKAVGRLEEAESSYSRALALSPGLTPALMNRWEVLFKLGNYEAALRDADCCDTPISKLYGLQSLYALGQTEEIYRRLESDPGIDDSNIHVAAFAAFLSWIEKKPAAHPFCNNPLDFIHVTNIASHIGNSTDFITALIKDLQGIRTEWEPARKSTFKGFQTPSDINLFAMNTGAMAQLRSLIEAELDLYRLKFQEETCAFIKKWPSANKLFGWHVILKQQGHQTPHIHATGWLSGVVYLKVVPALEQNEGAIEFSLNSPNFFDESAPRVIHQPAAGDIVLFPSSLHHRTIPFSTDTDRIVIAFDLMPGV